MMEPIFRSVQLKYTHGGFKKLATEFMMLKKVKMIQLTFKGLAGLADVNYTHQFKTFFIDEDGNVGRPGRREV